MPRKIGWENKDITGGRGGGPDRERRFRGQKGTTFVIRIMSECEEFRQHFVDDVLEPDKSGEPRGFNMVCSKTWDDDAEDYVGECKCCDREYGIGTKYIASILVMGLYKGRSTRVQTMDPENAVHYWDFGPDKYRQISDIVLELQRAKKPKSLRAVELTVKCEDEQFQKLNISISQADPILDADNKKDYVECWKEEGPALVKAASQAPNLAEQGRRLKKKKPRDSDRDEDDDEEDEPKPKKRTKKRAKKPDPDPDEDDEEESTGDEELDDLLDDL